MSFTRTQAFFQSIFLAMFIFSVTFWRMALFWFSCCFGMRESRFTFKCMQPWTGCGLRPSFLISFLLKEGWTREVLLPALLPPCPWHLWHSVCHFVSEMDVARAERALHITGFLPVLRFKGLVQKQLHDDGCNLRGVPIVCLSWTEAT